MGNNGRHENADVKMGKDAAMKRLLWSFSGLLALACSTSQAMAQMPSPSTEWRTADILDAPYSNGALPATRVKRAGALLGEPKLPAVKPLPVALEDSVQDTQPSKLPETINGRAAIGAPEVNFDCDMRQRGFFIGAGVYFARPVFSSNPAFVSTTITTTGVGPDTLVNQSQDFNWDFQATPKIWMGYLCDNGWGIAFNFWHFQSDPETAVFVPSADSPTVQNLASTVGALPIPVMGNVPPNPPDTLRVDSTLQLDTYDIEAIMAGTYERGYLKFGFGARYAYLRQTYSASLINAVTQPQFFQNETNTFSGAGPTVSGELGCQIWRRFGVYGMGRFSLLFGESAQEASQSITGIPPDALATASNSKMTTIPAGELELGLCWRTNVRRSQFFVKTGVAAQMWWDAGAASIPAGGSFSALGVFFPVNTATSSNLGFLGWTFSMGLNY